MSLAISKYALPICVCVQPVLNCWCGNAFKIEIASSQSYRAIARIALPSACSNCSVAAIEVCATLLIRVGGPAGVSAATPPPPPPPAGVPGMPGVCSICGAIFPFLFGSLPAPFKEDGGGFAALPPRDVNSLPLLLNIGGLSAAAAAPRRRALFRGCGGGPAFSDIGGAAPGVPLGDGVAYENGKGEPSAEPVGTNAEPPANENEPTIGVVGVVANIGTANSCRVEPGSVTGVYISPGVTLFAAAATAAVAADVVLVANGDDMLATECGISGCFRRPVGTVFGVLNATVVGTAAGAVMFVALKMLSQSKSTPSSDSLTKHDHKHEFCVSALW